MIIQSRNVTYCGNRATSQELKLKGDKGNQKMKIEGASMFGHLSDDMFDSICKSSIWVNGV